MLPSSFTPHISTDTISVMVDFFLKCIGVLFLGISLIVAFQAAPSYANTVSDSVCKNWAKAQENKSPDQRVAPPAGCEGTAVGGQLLEQGAGGATAEGYIKKLVNAFIFAAGIVALIFLILGAIRYITSDGNNARIQQAKETVLYSIIGLIVVALAVPIADFVIDTLT